MESGFKDRASRNVLCSAGSSAIKDCCSLTSALSRSSSSHKFIDLAPPDIAFAMVMAAEVPPDGGAAAAFWAAFWAWITEAKASLMAFASFLAASGDVNVNMWATGSACPGCCANIFSITFGFDSGVCCRFVTLAALMVIAGEAPGGCKGDQETDFRSFDIAIMPFCFL